jgi:prephenate dehydrogenase
MRKTGKNFRLGLKYSQREDERMRIAIIGGSGKMGRWFADFLLKDGKEVVITGKNRKKLREAGEQLGRVETTTDNASAVENADAVLVSVPIDKFAEVVAQFAPYTHSGQIITDVTSVKAAPVEVMHRYIKEGITLGMHPMFGPGAKGVANQNFVLTPTGEGEMALAQKVKLYLESRGAKVRLMSPHQHDEMVTIILGLSHFIAIVAADSLANLSRLDAMETIGSSSFRVLLTLVGSVISEDPEFYASLQMSLPNLAKIEEQFYRNSTSWADLVKNQNRREFARRMGVLKDKLEKSGLNLKKAYENMYRVVE